MTNHITVDKTLGTPIFTMGNLGLHIMSVPAGHYVFVGSLPVGLQKTCGTFDECLDVFKSWFISLDTETQREQVVNLRNDVFAYIYNQN